MRDDETPVVVTSDQGRHPSRLRAKLATRNGLMGLLGLVVLVAALGFGFWALTHRNQHTDTQTATSTPDKIQPIEVKYEQLANQALMEKVNYMLGTKQYEEAEKLVSMQKDLDTDKTKLSLLMTIQTAAGKKDEALQTAGRLAELGNLSSGEYAELGRQYDAAGDKAKAIEFFQKSIDAYNKEKRGNYKSEVQRLEDRIKELQAS